MNNIHLRHNSGRNPLVPLFCLVLTGLYSHGLLAQQQVDFTAPPPPPGYKAPLPTGPFFYDTAEGNAIRVVVVARGLNHPWSINFLPNGTALVTEKNNGQLRIIRNNVLDPRPISGIPTVVSNQFSGLLDVVLHPQFGKNHFIYLTYVKPLPEGGSAVALMRGRWDGKDLQQATDIFIADQGTFAGSRIAFGADGMLYMGIFGAFGKVAQDTNYHAGKVLRLKDDGSVPRDNPFVGVAGHKSEIYSIGHRSISGLVLHGGSGKVWELEMGPNGGDEVNILKAGANYGWPLVSTGRDYAGPWQSKNFNLEGMDGPVIYWMPAISVSGMTFYSGDKFPKWKGNLFVGGLRTGEIPGTGCLQRFLFNENMEELRRETLLADLHQRIRDVRESPDGYIYVVTDEDNGAVLKIEPK